MTGGSPDEARYDGYLRCCAGCGASLCTWDTSPSALCDKCKKRLAENLAKAPKLIKGDRCKDRRSCSPIFSTLIILAIDGESAMVRALGDPEGRVVKPHLVPLADLIPDGITPY